MDFFRKAADAVGGLILDSDSESDDERGTTVARDEFVDFSWPVFAARLEA